MTSSATGYRSLHCPEQSPAQRRCSGAVSSTPAGPAGFLHDHRDRLPQRANPSQPCAPIHPAWNPVRLRLKIPAPEYSRCAGGFREHEPCGWRRPPSPTPAAPKRSGTKPECGAGHAELQGRRGRACEGGLLRRRHRGVTTAQAARRKERNLTVTRGGCQRDRDYGQRDEAGNDEPLRPQSARSGQLRRCCRNTTDAEDHQRDRDHPLPFKSARFDVVMSWACPAGAHPGHRRHAGHNCNPVWQGSKKP